MPKLSPADELLNHQIPEPFTHVATHHDFWRESLFFVFHPRDQLGDVEILTVSHYPKRQAMDAQQLGRVGKDPIFLWHNRPYGDDPHKPTVGPVSIDIIEPYKTILLKVDPETSPLGMDITFTARTQPYGLRRGTMKAGHEIIWDQSHMLQSGTYNGTYTYKEKTYNVDNWWGQRDHSWGIRDHSRCPLWMWYAIQLPDGMFGVWHWEYPNGARVYTDGCFAPADGSDPIPVVDFHHDLNWTGEDRQPVEYGLQGENVRGLAGHVDITLENRQRIGIDAEGRWAQYYGTMGGGLHEMVVRTDDGREGTAIYEVTGAHHHHFFPEARAENLPPG
ncbi:MAG: hypothetical protein V3S89_13700 [Desulfobacterales bacterium]